MHKKNIFVTVIFGCLGGHYFINKNWSKGFLYFFTFGLFGFGWFYDIYRAIVGRSNEFIKSSGNIHTKTLMLEEDIKKIENNILPIIDNNDILLKKDEICVFKDSAYTRESKTRVAGYTSEGSRVSFRLSKNISVGSGGRKSKAVRETYNIYNYGLLFLTNQRIIFSSEKFSFDKKIEQITYLKDNLDGIEIQIGNKTYDINIHSSTLFCKVLDILLQSNNNEE